MLAGAVVGAACSGGGTPSPAVSPTAALDAGRMAEAYAARGPHPVGVATVEFVDTTRGTQANRDAPARPERRLTVEVWYPAAAPASGEAEVRDAPLEGGPYPLVLFAHGFSSFRRQSATFAQHLASHGYVVASPDFPESNIAAPGGPRIRALLDQPRDITFVLDELIARNAEPGWPLAGGIDAARIGVTGHSLGGMTAMLAGFGPERDPRVRAVVPISPSGCVLPPESVAGASAPAMVIGGSRELIVDPASIHDAYERAGVPRYYVEIAGADHTRFSDFDITDEQIGDFVSDASDGNLLDDAMALTDAYDADIGGCDESAVRLDDALIPGDRQRELLRTVATPFLDAYLREDASALRFLREALPSLAGVRVEMEPGR